MSLLRRLVDDRRESRVATLSDLLALGERGRTTWAGVPVSPKSALGMAAVWACVRLLVDTISTLPVSAYRKQADVRQKLLNQPSIVTEPSANLSRPEFIGQIVHAAVTQGNAYALVTGRDALGFATQLEPRDPADVAVKRIGKSGPPIYFFDNREVPLEDVVHVRGLMPPGGIVGISAIELARNAIGVGLAAERYGAQWFSQGAHPSGVLESDDKIPDEDTARTIKQRFIDAVRGREPIVLGAGVKWKAIQEDPQTSQLSVTEQWAAEQACRFFGIPPEMIGLATSGSSVTYANREQRAIDFVSFAVTPWLVRIEQPWSALLPRGQFVRFIVDGLLRSDTLTRYNAHGVAIRSGWRSVNETRRLEDDEPIGEDGDRYLWPPFGTKSEKTESDGQN